jgi:hypothetical protein
LALEAHDEAARRDSIYEPLPQRFRERPIIQRVRTAVGDRTIGAEVFHG